MNRTMYCRTQIDVLYIAHRSHIIIESYIFVPHEMYSLKVMKEIVLWQRIFMFNFTV